MPRYNLEKLEATMVGEKLQMQIIAWYHQDKRNRKNQLQWGPKLVFHPTSKEDAKKGDWGDDELDKLGDFFDEFNWQFQNPDLMYQHILQKLCTRTMVQVKNCIIEDNFMKKTLPFVLNEFFDTFFPWIA